MRVDYQLSSHTPVTEIAVQLNGGIVAQQTGTGLSDSGGMWFLAPLSGSYALTVEAKNAFGCARTATALFPVVVK